MRRGPGGWAAAIFTALGEQTVVVAGTNAAVIVLPQLAGILAQLRTSRSEILAKVEALVEAHPHHSVLTSIPAAQVRTEARILTEVAGKEFKTAGHLATYAGLAQVTCRSGTSIRGDDPSKRGNKNLKRASFLSAFAALKAPRSRANYERKQTDGKRHNPAPIVLPGAATTSCFRCSAMAPYRTCNTEEAKEAWLPAADAHPGPTPAARLRKKTRPHT